MNLIERTSALFKAFTLGYDLPLLMKAANDRGVNLMERDLYRYLNVDSPVFMDHNATNYINKGFAFNADVYAIINYRANLVGSIPFKLYRKTGPQEFELIQEDETGLLELANSLDRRALSIYEDTVGNAYVYAPFIESNNSKNKGKTLELSVLKADMVQIVTGGKNEPIRGYKYTSSDYNFSVPASDVLHFKNFNPNTDPHDSLYGMSPLKAAVQQISLSNDGSFSMNKAFKNQGVKAIVFSKDSQHASWQSQDANTLKDAWGKLNGTHTTGSVAFASKELGKIDMGMSMVELETLNGLLHNFRQICNVFDGFPSVLLNDNVTSTYNNLDSADKRVYTNCAIPRAIRYRDGLNRWLTPRYGADLWLDLDTSGIDVLQENKVELAQWLEKSPFIKWKDKQKLMGVTEDENADFYVIPAGFVAVKDINDIVPPDTSVEEAVKQLKAKGL